MYHPVGSCLGFRQGELFSLSVISPDNQSARFNIDVFPRQRAQFSMSHASVNSQGPEIFDLLVVAGVNESRKFVL